MLGVDLMKVNRVFTMDHGPLRRVEWLLVVTVDGVAVHSLRSTEKLVANSGVDQSAVVVEREMCA